MSITHFAQLDNENKVIHVEVVDASNTLDSDGNHSETVGISYLKSLHGLDTTWVETFYDGSSRYRYAGIGMTYSSEFNVFIEKKPEQYPSWILNEEIYAYEPPVSEPELTEEQLNNGDQYVWDETTVSWDFVEAEPEPELEPNNDGEEEEET